MGLRRKHQAENQTQPIVDLDNYDIKNDPTDVRIRLMEAHDPADAERVVPFMDKGDIVVISMDMFAGSNSDAENFIEGIRIKSHSIGYSLCGSGNTYIVAPNHVTVKKV